MAATTTPTAVAPFEHRFSFEDDHCSWRIEDAGEYLSDRLCAEIDGLDIFDAHTRLKEILEAHEDEDEEAEPMTGEELVGLQEFIFNIDRCATYRCECAMEIWQDSEKDFFNEQIASLGDHRWGIQIRDRPDSPPWGTLDLDTVFNLLRWRDGYSNVAITWDGDGDLSITFGDGHGGRSEVQLVPLSELAECAFDRWVERDYGAEDAAALACARAKAEALNATIGLFEMLGEAEVGDDLDFGDALLHFAEAPALDDHELYVVRGLAADWDLGVTALLESSRILQLA